MVDTFNVRCGKRELNIAFSSTLSNVDRAIDKTLNFCRENHIQLDIYGLRLVLHEGLTNATVHGNCLDPSMNVSYSLEVRDGYLEIKIIDKGVGFKPEFGQSLDLPNMPRGRGLDLMKAYSNKISYNSTGNELTVQVLLKLEKNQNDE